MLGLIANPASGKDIRRLISGASVFDNQEKRNIVRRAVIGALGCGETQFVYLDDGHGIVADAVARFEGDGSFRALTGPRQQTAADTIDAARQMRELGCGAVLVLGGDGTNRAAAGGWRDIPVVPVSTGTNNVFPSMTEGTLAGMSAAFVSTGTVPLADVARQTKAIHVQIKGEEEDLALIDLALVEGTFSGSKAVWEPARLRAAVLARAEPASVGLSAIGALLDPLGDTDDGGLMLEFGGGGVSVHAPIAPGLITDVAVRTCRRIPFGETVVLEGPGVLAFDGERERTLKPRQPAAARVFRDGPWVIDVTRAMTVAAQRGLLRRGARK